MVQSLPRQTSARPGQVDRGGARAEDLLACFSLVREVGRGGMGVVYEGVHRTTRQRRAIKLVNSCSPDSAMRMFREAQAASMLRSKHATRIDAFAVTPEGTPYIVMELLEGVDLATLLAQSHGGLPLETALEIVRQACEVVGEAHGYGIVHRDLKPANIFVTRRLDGEIHVKLLDFGLAKLGAHKGVPLATCSGSVFGTPHYMSPEQLKSSTNVDATADVWALGVILHQLVYGVLPFDGDNVSQVIARILEGSPRLPMCQRVPADVQRIIRRCLAKKPDARFRDARALGAEIERTPHGATNPLDFTGVTPRPWSIDQLANVTTREIEIADPRRAPWGRLEWIAAAASCVVMLVAGVLMSPALHALASSAPRANAADVEHLPPAPEPLPVPALATPPVLLAPHASPPPIVIAVSPEPEPVVAAASPSSSSRPSARRPLRK